MSNDEATFTLTDLIEIQSAVVELTKRFGQVRRHSYLTLVVYRWPESVRHRRLVEIENRLRRMRT